VLNPLKGSAVRRAEVFLGPYRSVADTNGRYRFTSVKPGRYRIYAERPGFWPARQWLTLTDCPSVRQIDLTLLAAAAIGGHVYDEAGEPLLVNVQLWRETWKHGFRELLEVTRQTTEEGGYRFFGLPAGRYSVSTAQTPIRETRQAYDQTFYPSPLIVVPGGEARDIDFHLRRTSTVTLGLTIEGTFAADQFVSIDLESQERTANLHLATNDSKFDIDGLTTGSYKLIATSRYEDQRYYAFLNINVGAVDIRGLPVRLLPALDVQAKLRFEGDHAPAAPVALSLSPRETAHPEEDGSYKWNDVTPGAYSLNADLPEDLYFKSGRTIEISPGKQGPFEVVVSAGAARLEGNVHFPDTVDKVRVVLVGKEIEKNALAGPDGSFALTGIAPGQHTLIAIEEDEDQNWRNPETLKALIAKGARLDLSPASTIHRDLALTR
jgi:hypothetical protein